MKGRVAVLGAGSWGTVLAAVLADNGHDVTLWARREEQAQEIDQTHTNRKYLPDVKLPETLRATSSLSEALEGKEAVLFAVPSHSMREIAREARRWIEADALVIHAAKGFEIDSLKRMSEVLAEELGASHADRITVLSGPSHAEEVIRRCPTTVVVASQSAQAAEQAQMLFMNSYFRVYTNPDVIGVEVGGALKNIIALSAGLVDGLGFGDNAKAALLTRGLAEIARLGHAMGAEPITFVGLAGVGDLVVTCTSSHSRNWRAGHMISQGKKLDEVLATMGMVVEGVRTTKAAYVLKERYQVEMPIAEQLYSVLFADKDPEQAVKELMGRGRTQELEEIIGGW
ncbi:glycerol-3-phosphate dehydrogenase (NAD(P)+) [Laceyella sediminis]|jgi:glycerol-3-phosphate dehydrogenase (NAD(P)+)|uniref:Glycerol-3-phosphate dehydrogenase [NAD(P)+] n=1 Tax=Laceyella sediminis TaxID=573074 RepID=A0ABX5ES79_9BACL|nr:NAD(P)H-dependent glycerol-3-phosphate dehydrogenase [Laceyella sediminis]PRZ14388.1 glycerol-3-phosphate dehydrogenase (NAD(P)+) [Laceyella sediminis]